MKKLICAKDVEAAVDQGKKVIYIDSNTIVTPSAKDIAQNHGIEFSTETQISENKASEAAKALGGGIDSDLIYTVLKALADKGLLEGILASLKGQPFDAEQDKSGVKLVRGNTVKYDVLETDDPNAKAYYQELVNKNDGAMRAGFLTIERSSFGLEVNCEEIYYVIEGTMTIEINGNTFTARPGDVLFIPPGVKVTLGSPDQTKVFYATYPTN